MDAAELLLDAARHADHEVQVFNGASGEAVTVAELAQEMARHFSNVHLSYSGAVRKGDPKSLVGNIDRARAAGLVAPTHLRTGLKHTLQWLTQENGGQ